MKKEDNFVSTQKGHYFEACWSKPVPGPLLSAILIRETRLDSTPTEDSSTVGIWTANNTSEAYQRVTVSVQWLRHVTLPQAHHW